MRLIKAVDLAKQLGISTNTMRRMCAKDPSIAIKRKGVYYICLENLATKPGFDLVGALLLPTKRWVKAIEVARKAGISRKTVSNWCRTRQRFACRIGRIWYIDIETFDGILGQK